MCQFRWLQNFLTKEIEFYKNQLLIDTGKKVLGEVGNYFGSLVYGGQFQKDLLTFISI